MAGYGTGGTNRSTMAEDNQASLPVTALAALFGFEPDEVALNRAGRLSLRQRQDARYRDMSGVVRGTAGVVLTSILAASLHAQLSPAAQAALVAGIAALAALAIRAGYRMLYPGVARATGTLSRAGNARYPAIAIDGWMVRVSYRRWKRLPDTPGRYVVYYTRTTRRLLSIEPWNEDA